MIKFLISLFAEYVLVEVEIVPKNNDESKFEIGNIYRFHNGRAQRVRFNGLEFVVAQFDDVGNYGLLQLQTKHEHDLIDRIEHALGDPDKFDPIDYPANNVKTLDLYGIYVTENTIGRKIDIQA